MSEEKFSLDEFAQKIADTLRQVVPLNEAMWDAADIGHYLRRSPQVVRERIACLPSFPRPVKLPSARNGKVTSGHPLWQAIEVINWVKSHREQPVGRPRKFG